MEWKYVLWIIFGICFTAGVFFSLLTRNALKRSFWLFITTFVAAFLIQSFGFLALFLNILPVNYINDKKSLMVFFSTLSTLVVSGTITTLRCKDLVTFKEEGHNEDENKEYDSIK